MTRPARVPITVVAVFGVGALIASAVGVAVWLGFASARESTRALLAERAQTLVGAMEATIEDRFRPVVEQSRWVRAQVESGAVDVTDVAGFDGFIRGVFAGTPEVAGIALVFPDGHSRRWRRVFPEPIDEDWSDQAPVRAWLEDGRSRDQGAWSQPFWTSTLDETVLLHDEPLVREDGFVGMFAQVVPVARLSKLLVRAHVQAGLVPFVLYGRDRVLAHPLSAAQRTVVRGGEIALPTLGELGDEVLSRIWSPDEERLTVLRNVVDLHTALVEHEGNEYVFLYRWVRSYGPTPWVVGAYLDTRWHGGDEVGRVVRAGLGGVGVMVAAVALAMVVGHRVSRRLTDLSEAAHAVESGRLDEAEALGGSRIREIDDAMRAFGQMVAGLRERDLVRSTLGRFVPEPIARRLLDAGGRLEPRETESTILFCDIEGFTALTESLGPSGIIELLNAFFSEMVHVLERYGGVVTQFQGDAILATFNVAAADPAHASKALRAALEMQHRCATSTFAGERLAIRIGINTGTVVAGAVGADARLSYTVHGDAVNLAARLEAMNKRYGTRVLASERTIDGVHGFEVRRIGEAQVRGQTRPVAVYEVVGFA